MELNLENPIFVYYLNTTGRSRQSIEHQLKYLNDNFSNIKNINSNFKKFRKEINDFISKNEDIRPALRKLILDDILD